MFVASLSYATNSVELVEKFPVNTVSDCVESSSDKVTNDKPLDCSISTTSTVTTNADGSTTRTTTTNVSCDTPQELAQLHAAMAALGMGI
ncbi:hypothetical protein [Flavobacterium sp.]|uniref:hypothetical protein n=1 Tax=Flavobacterium sp. TaxID=239 RepID=UPI0040478EA0